MKLYVSIVLCLLCIGALAQNEKNYSQTFNSNSYRSGKWIDDKSDWDFTETIKRVSKITIKDKKVFLSDIEVLDILDDGQDTSDGDSKSIQWNCKDKEGEDVMITVMQFADGESTFSIFYFDDYNACNIYDLTTTPDVFGSGFHFPKIK